MNQKGFSLVELMISMVIGMIIIAAAITTYTATFGANSGQMKYSRLNNDLRSVMTQITRDLRRSGYRSGLNTSATTSPTVSGTNNITGIAYDLNGDATISSTTESFGYKYEAVNPGSTGCTTYSGTGAVGAICTSIDGGASWSRLTDPQVITVGANDFVVTERTPPKNISGTHCTTLREYEIQLTGHLTSDVNVSRSIRETVRPRNEVVATDSTCL